MAFIVADRVRETSTTTGTGTFTLSGAVSGYQTFSSAIGNTNTTYYTISNSSANEWEVGLGTVGAGTLARTTILSSSNAGSAVDFSAGTKDVFCTYPAEKTVFTDNTATLTNKTISGASNTFSNIGNSSLTNSAVTVGSTSVSLGATTTTLAGLTSVASGQVNITGQGDLRLEDTTGGEYVALQAPATLAASYTLTMPSDDGTNGQVLTTDGSGNLAWATDAGGDVVGPSSATDNAVSRFDGTTGKLIQNSGVIIDDSNNVTGVVNLTSSGSVTLSGGTANGVAYLNGSNVLTTGSALTFDGTTQLSINSSANAILKINATYGAGASIIDLTASGSTAQDTRIVGGAGSTSNISFITSGSEQMRLTSTGLGIGTSSPTAGYKLDVYGSIICSGNIYDTGTLALAGATAPTTANNERITISNQYDGTIQARYYGAPGSNQKYLNVGWNMQTYGSGSSGYMINGVTGIYRSSAGGSLYVAADQHLFGSLSADGFTNASPTFTERMRLDSSGNLGLGVTPSAWSSGGKLELGGSQGISTQGAYNFFGANLYYNGGWKYTTSAQATYFEQAAGAFKWFTAPSGTAGDAITFTQAMTLDASGNLGVGTASPSSRLHTYTSSGANKLIVEAGAASQQAVLQLNTNSATPGQCQIYMGKASAPTNGQVGYDPNSDYMYLYTGNTERMRIDSSGNVGIGVTNPSELLQVNGTARAARWRADSQDAAGPAFSFQSDTNTGLFNPSADVIGFGTGGSERMRIDSTGNILVAQAARATITTDNDLSFDMNAASNFQCTPSATGALTFTNITSGQSGYVLLINTGGYAITAAASTKVGSTFLSTVSTAGTYLISYFSTGSAVYCTASGALS